jgi:FkbH-like protein
LDAVPPISETRAKIEAAIAQADPAAAFSLVRALWAAHGGLATSRFVEGCIGALAPALTLPQCRVAIVRSFTVEPLISLLRAEAFVEGLNLDVYVGGFNTYMQESLNQDDELYAYSPNVIIAAIGLREVAPELWANFGMLRSDDVDAVCARVTETMQELLTHLRSHSAASILLHNFEMPPTLSAGVLDAQQQGQSATVRRLNAQLQQLAAATPGVYIVDYDELVAQHGRKSWYDEAKWAAVRLPLSSSSLLPLAREWVRYLRPLAGPHCKAVVVDLDNTLWGGVVGEDGIEGLQLGLEAPGAHYTAFQQSLLDLYHRGIILAVCSKNNHADAMEVIERHPQMLLRSNHLAAVRINWNDKPANIREIAAELNIGLDAICFIDDNPVERELVLSQLPMVTVLDLPPSPALYAAALRAVRPFERLSLSAEDRERGVYYAQERLRNEEQQGATSIEDFYRSLKLCVTVEEAQGMSLGRVAQLTQKTNQFNLTTRRYTEQDVTRMVADPTWRVYGIHVSDRFGDSGLTGVLLVQCGGELAEIDTFLLSCRVMGRTVEHAALCAITDLLRAEGIRRVEGEFIPTAKNAPVRDLYALQGFERVAADAGGATRWALDLGSQRLQAPDWITLSVRGGHAVEASGSHR